MGFCMKKNVENVWFYYFGFIVMSLFKSYLRPVWDDECSPEAFVVFLALFLTPKLKIIMKINVDGNWSP